VVEGRPPLTVRAQPDTLLPVPCILGGATGPTSSPPLSLLPLLPASPFSGAEGRISMLAGYQSHPSNLPALLFPHLTASLLLGLKITRSAESLCPHDTTSTSSPSPLQHGPQLGQRCQRWVEGEPATTASNCCYFILLYHHCVASDLSFHFNINNYSSCYLTAPPSTSVTKTSQRRCWCRCTCGITAATAGQKTAPPPLSPSGWQVTFIK
jgi:hypothetical protein